MQRLVFQKVNANSRKSGTHRLKRQNTAAVVHSVVKNAAEQAQLKKKQLERRKKSSMSRLQSRLDKRNSRAKMKKMTTPRITMEPRRVEFESSVQVKCTHTKAAVRKGLGSKDKLRTFMTRADKKHSGVIQRKHVQFLIAGVRKRFHSDDVAFDDDVWQSMKKNSKLVNSPTAIEHNVLEEWVFGDV